jgi:hypothetical protein
MKSLASDFRVQCNTDDNGGVGSEEAAGSYIVRTYALWLLWIDIV